MYRGVHLKRSMKQKEGDNFVTVYSAGQGRLCPACGNTIENCTCRSKKPAPQGDGIVRVSRETKGRRGKAVTVIAGVPLDHDRLLKLAKELKQKCGSGGTVKDVSSMPRGLKIFSVKKSAKGMPEITSTR